MKNLLLATVSVISLFFVSTAGALTYRDSPSPGVDASNNGRAGGMVNGTDMNDVSNSNSMADLNHTGTFNGEMKENGTHPSNNPSGVKIEP